MTEIIGALAAQRTNPRSRPLVDAISASLSACTCCASSATPLVDVFAEDARRLVTREGGPCVPPLTRQDPR
jgi:hypothetical protein